ncbi:MAG: VCBS domain-containing protein [Cyanobacteria bacterium P01_A01_bin.123]
MVTFNQQTGANNPFNGIDVGFSSTPTFADIDGDGDFDALVGESDGNLNYFENTGSTTNPVYEAQTGADNLFNGIDVGFSSTPTLADIDGDGDFDALVGERDGSLYYFENTGSATNPVYEQQTGADNPFNGIEVGFRSEPTLADIDGDGDLDALVGEQSGTLNYFENTGSATNPVYEQQTGADNPFNGIDVGAHSTPTLADIDGDGDLDALVGEYSGNLNYFENTSSATNPVYEQQTGADNPFNGIDLGNYSTPTLADIDGDGDLDAVVGERDGNLNYFENNQSPAAVGDNIFTDEDTAVSGNVLVDNGNGADSDADGDPLTVVAVNGVAANVGTEISLASGSLLTLNADGTFNYDPNGQFEDLQSGRISLEFAEYTISDGNGGTSTANVFFRIDGVNDAAVITGDIGGTVTEDAAINTTSGQLSATDVDSPNGFPDFFPQTNTGGTYGTFAIDASGNWTYTLDNSDADTDALATGEVANDVFNVATADGTLQAVTITVNGVTDNTAPTVANAIADQSATTFSSFLFTLPGNTFDDADGDSLTLTATLDNGNPLPTWLSFDGATGTFSGFATGNEVGTLAIQVTADDGTATSSDVFDLSIGFPNTPITTNSINGDSTPNSLNGTNANDLISGKGANDVLEGARGNDILRGGSGADDMNGGRGHDQLLGEGGDDLLFGDRGADTLVGGKGRDILAGGRGDDILDGGNGLDELEGGSGNDFLFGGNGRDILIGGDGRDQFLLLAGTGEDRILDFENGRDTFVLTGGIGFNDLSITTNLVDDVLISLNGQRLATVEAAGGLIDAADFVTR